ncbi:hypothetical protein FHU13_003798 [Methylobacterium sp. R2-1]|nr:hypothetical protein [Methylobacterium sp. R2-1]
MQGECIDPSGTLCHRFLTDRAVAPDFDDAPIITAGNEPVGVSCCDED